MSAKPTAGPWKTKGDMARITDASGNTIGDAYWAKDDGSLKVTDEQMAEANANARLMAAAPDLLETLQDVVEAEGLLDPAKRSPWFGKAYALVVRFKGDE